MAAFAEICRSEGLKATHQRTEVYRELARTREHPDAETIYRRVRRRIPSISLDTVYRTLRLLEGKGVISRVGALGERARFDANLDRHHHFVCRQCGLVRDFYSPMLDTLPIPKQASDIGRIDAMQVEFRGRCAECGPSRERKGEQRK